MNKDFEDKLALKLE